MTRLRGSARLASFMKRLAILVGFGAGMLAASGAVFADDGLPPPPPSMDPEDALNPISIVSGQGISLGEGTVFHPQLGVETGVVSNVFYEETGPVTAGLIRI